MEDEQALALALDGDPTPLTPAEAEAEEDVPLLGKKDLDCLIAAAVKARRALADLIVLEEGLYLTDRNKVALRAADAVILRVLRQARDDYSIA